MSQDVMVSDPSLQNTLDLLEVKEAFNQMYNTGSTDQIGDQVVEIPLLSNESSVLQVQQHKNIQMLKEIYHNENILI